MPFMKASGSLSTSTWLLKPALLTITSMRPKRAIAVSTTFLHCGTSVSSAAR
jgi:hypothetical protein